MTLDQLKAFVAVVENGSIRSAARTLGVAQSGLTKQIKRLEQTIGTTLFVRASSGIVLTSYATTLLARARIILSECARAEQDVIALRGAVSGKINVGASSEAFARLMLSSVGQLRVAHPMLSMHIASGPSSLLLSALREGKLDFVVTLITRHSDMTDLSSVRLTGSSPKILCRKGHRLEAKTSIRDLVGSEWVNTGRLDQEGTPSNRLGDWFVQNGLQKPTIAVSVESLLDTLNLVSNSDYLFLGPQYVLEQSGFEHKLSSIEVSQSIPESDICLVQRSAAPLTPGAQAFASMLISYNRMTGSDSTK
ncbi:LysR family transcriptional regulator [Orrella sp. NBD-18]|uniref:LysR family transcriptional regulator n=1 Tax=Sheuella amnicola TaxID=2707330 RepID=A0A6B2R348_9BURK|nr:LysR substrate-binding domain-containing protein [Sheuella amnicola]NDY84114.1 LysR family transcriptional regulator [Sheuella amnicola]HBI83589.1 LysR family transcriptional regulator [Alcaligenaceae bacterium]